LLVDVSSRGADLLLNVGPDAEGNIPPVQERCLQDLGQWVKAYGGGIFGTSKVDADTANPSGETSGAWVRWTRNGNRLFAFVDSIDEQKEIQLLFAPEKVDIASAKILGGGEISIDAKGTLQPQQLGDHLRPVCVEFVAT
jgi:alpha-L-fucosidase